VEKIHALTDRAGTWQETTALAVIHDGGSRKQAAEMGGVTLQVVRDWVLRFNAEGPEGLIDRKAPGPPSRFKDAHRAALAEMIENGPVPAVHGVVRWRIIDLCQWVWDEFEIIVSRQTLSRELRTMGYRKLSARPRHHAQAAGAIEAFKKRMARPVCKGNFTRRVGLHQRIRSQGLNPGQDGLRAPQA
jgi:transposase